MQVLMAMIYLLNYKSTVAKAWRRWRVYHERTGACERKGRKVLKTFRDRTRLLREAKPCSIMRLRAFSPPVCFLRYIRLEFRFSSARTSDPKISLKKKIISGFIRKSVIAAWCAIS